MTRSCPDSPCRKVRSSRNFLSVFHLLLFYLSLNSPGSPIPSLVRTDTWDSFFIGLVSRHGSTVTCGREVCVRVQWLGCSDEVYLFIRLLTHLLIHCCLSTRISRSICSGYLPRQVRDNYIVVYKPRGVLYRLPVRFTGTTVGLLYGDSLDLVRERFVPETERRPSN